MTAVGFSLSRTEITNKQYARFVDAGGYTDDNLSGFRTGWLSA